MNKIMLFKELINNIIIYIENIIKDKATDFDIFCSVNVIIIKK